MTPNDDEALELMNNEIAARLSRQSDATNRLDTKATLLLGFVVTAVPLLLANEPNWCLAGAALFAFVLAFGLGVLALRPRDFQDVPDPNDLASMWSTPRREVLGLLIGTRLHAFENNQKVNKRKAYQWHAALVALVVGVALSGVAVGVGRSDADAGGREDPCRSTATGDAAAEEPHRVPAGANQH